MTPELDELAETSRRMALELQQFVDDAIDASGDSAALRDVQALLRDWENRYVAAGFGWQGLITTTDTDGGDCLIDKL